MPKHFPRHLLPSETENHLPAKLFIEKCWKNNFVPAAADTVALLKSCIVFPSIILAREELLINVLEHTGATDDRLEGEKLKAIRKQLFLNHPLTLSSHCVAYLSIFPYTLPSLISPLFVPSIPARVSKCALYETLRTGALWLIKLPPRKTDRSYFVQQIHFCCVYLCWAGGRHSQADE